MISVSQNSGIKLKLSNITREEKRNKVGFAILDDDVYMKKITQLFLFAPLHVCLLDNIIDLN